MSELPPTGGSHWYRALVYFEKLTQHQLRALLAPVPPRGRLPGLLPADTDSGLPVMGRVWSCAPSPPPACSSGPPGLRLLFQMIKHTVLGSSKPQITRLPHGQQSYSCLFPRAAASLWLPPHLPLFSLALLSFLRQPYSPSSFLPFVFPCVFVQGSHEAAP